MTRPKNMWVSDEFEREVRRMQEEYRRQYKDISKVDITRDIAKILKRKT